MEFLVNTGDSVATAVTYENNADVTVESGNLVIGTSGKGIDFSATSDFGGMTSEVLDDYEEGTWSATILSDSGTITINEDYDLGRYTKIGRLVHIQGKFVVDSVSSPLQGLHINQLPFTAANDSEGAAEAAAAVRLTGLQGGIESFMGYVAENNTLLYIQEWSGTTGDDMADHVAASTSIMISAIYTV